MSSPAPLRAGLDRRPARGHPLLLSAPSEGEDHPVLRGDRLERTRSPEVAGRPGSAAIDSSAASVTITGSSADGVGAVSGGRPMPRRLERAHRGRECSWPATRIRAAPRIHVYLYRAPPDPPGSVPG